MYRRLPDIVSSSDIKWVVDFINLTPIKGISAIRCAQSNKSKLRRSSGLGLIRLVQACSGPGYCCR